MAACDCQHVREAVVLMDVAPRRPADNRPMTFASSPQYDVVRCYDRDNSSTPASWGQVINLIVGAVRQCWQAVTSAAALHDFTLAQPE